MLDQGRRAAWRATTEDAHAARRADRRGVRGRRHGQRRLRAHGLHVRRGGPRGRRDRLLGRRARAHRRAAGPAGAPASASPRRASSWDPARGTGRGSTTPSRATPRLVVPPDAPPLRSPALLAVLLVGAAGASGMRPSSAPTPPGQRVETSPARVTLVFTEPLNGRLARRDAASRRGRRGDRGRAAPAAASGSSWCPPASCDRRLPGRLAHGRDRGRARARGRVLLRRARAGRRRRAGARDRAAGARRAGADRSPASRSTPRAAARGGAAAAAADRAARAAGRCRTDPGDEGGRVDSRCARASGACAATSPGRPWRPRWWRWSPRRRTPRAGSAPGGSATSCRQPRGVARALVVVALLAARAAARPAAARRGDARSCSRSARSPRRVTPASADPRVPSILNDWLHLVSGAPWLGGIAWLVLLWWRSVRFARRGARARDRARGAGALRPDRGGRVPRRRRDRARLARHPARARRGAVGHRLRPAAGGQDRGRRADRGGQRRARAAPAAAAARRQRRAGGARAPPLALWRTEPWLGLAVVVAVAGAGRVPAAAAPARRRGQARPPVCDPCPLPAPPRTSSAWPSSAGSQRGRGLDPPHAGGGDRDRAACSTATASRRRCRSSCPARGRGVRRGCRRFRLPPARRGRVAVRERGRRYATALPAALGARAATPARARCSTRAEATMRAPARRARARAALQRPGHGRDDRVPAARAGPARVADGPRRAERRHRAPPVDPPARPRLARGRLRLRAGLQDPLWFAWRRYARAVRLLVRARRARRAGADGRGHARMVQARPWTSRPTTSSPSG